VRTVPSVVNLLSSHDDLAEAACKNARAATASTASRDRGAMVCVCVAALELFSETSLQSGGHFLVCGSKKHSSWRRFILVASRSAYVCPMWAGGTGHIFFFPSIIVLARRSLQLFGQHMGTIYDNPVRVFIHWQFHKLRVSRNIRLLWAQEKGGERGGWPMSYYSISMPNTSAKSKIHSTNYLPSVTFGKNVLANNASTKTYLSSTFCRPLSTKLFPNAGTRQKKTCCHGAK
jgi:hypothetical protein